LNISFFSNGINISSFAFASKITSGVVTSRLELEDLLPEIEELETDETEDWLD